MTPNRALICLASLTALYPLSAGAQAISYNTGGLGTVADGVNAGGVILDQPGALAAVDDYSSQYATGSNTAVPFRPELNPPASSPFTIEFWARPTAMDGDDAPIGNRLGGGGNRSGWVFFQRGEAVGWNFRMYNGNSSGLGWDITGGTATLNAWSHVVVVWNGSSASLHVNGQAIPAANAGNGVYNPNTTESFYVGALIGGGSPSTGDIDEVAYYPSALTPAQILNHYNLASSTRIGAYSSTVLADGAILYLQQNPPSTTITAMSPSPVIKFTGVLSKSTDLEHWTDVLVPSPYTVPADEPKTLFFRSHR